MKHTGIMKKINIIGGGLAGSEAALQFADRGWKVFLYDMRPGKMTPAHETGLLAEIVCSNSLKSELHSTASGLLKAEMQLLGCKLLNIAHECRVPAGNALAVDRKMFARSVTKIIEKHRNIEIIRKEVTELDNDLTIIATGPLTSDKLAGELRRIIGDKQLYFFDSIAPIVAAGSLDYNILYKKSRYDKGSDDYWNCPFSRDEYEHFVELLEKAEKHPIHEFEDKFFQSLKFRFYENCIPIEELARRGKETLRFGVMRPVGLDNPATGKRPYAVIQLRSENLAGNAFNLVGCQTMMKYGEQEKVFRAIPGFGKAEFLRLGSIHRNSYIDSPQVLNMDFSMKNRKNIYIAGQLAGVEGYMESILSGLLVAMAISEKLDLPPATTISGQLWRYLLNPNKNFQPMNANFGLLPDLEKKERDKKLKKSKLADRSLRDLQIFLGK